MLHLHGAFAVLALVVSHLSTAIASLTSVVRQHQPAYQQLIHSCCQTEVAIVPDGAANP